MDYENIMFIKHRMTVNEEQKSRGSASLSCSDMRYDNSSASKPSGDFSQERDFDQNG